MRRTRYTILYCAKSVDSTTVMKKPLSLKRDLHNSMDDIQESLIKSLAGFEEFATHGIVSDTQK